MFYFNRKVFLNDFSHTSVKFDHICLLLSTVIFSIGHLLKHERNSMAWTCTKKSVFVSIRKTNTTEVVAVHTLTAFVGFREILIFLTAHKV